MKKGINREQHGRGFFGGKKRLQKSKSGGDKRENDRETPIVIQHWRGC